MGDSISIFPLNSNQETTYKSTYIKEKLPETNGTEQLTEGVFPINLKLINQYQCK